MLLFNILLGLCYILQLCRIPKDSKIVETNSFLNSFSSKTAYRNSKIEEVEDFTMEINKCKLVHINALFRHGTRFSSKEDMEKIKNVHRKIMQSKIYQSLPESFIDWTSPFSINEEKQLASVGYEEMMQIGERFRKQFNKIDGNINNTKHIGIFSTSVARAKLSGTIFLQKFLQGKKTFDEASRMILEKDDELRFFDNCPHYTKSVLKNNSMKEEYKIFSEGLEAQNVVRNIKRKWNLMDVNLTIDDVRSLYVMCGYEIATNMSSYMLINKCNLSKEKNGLLCPKQTNSFSIENSPLCSLLEPEHYLIFEYMADLKHFWTKAYGSKINWLQSCDLMASMLNQILEAAIGHNIAYEFSRDQNITLEKVLNQQKYLRGVFWFAHAETVLPIVSLLGLYRQSFPLRASNFQKRLIMLKDSNQLFKTFRVSNISPFSGNIAIELYHCPGLTRNAQAGYMVRVKSNEKYIKWNLSNGKGQISLEEFKKHLNVCSPKMYNHFDVCVHGKGLEI